MESSPGLCRNTPSCALAQSAEPIAVPLYDPFVCPSCGAPLAPPILPAAAPRNTLLPICLAAAMVCAVIASATIWRLATRQETSITLAEAAIPSAPPVQILTTPAAPPGLTLEASTADHVLVADGGMTAA